MPEPVNIEKLKNAVALLNAKASREDLIEFHLLRDDYYAEYPELASDSFVAMRRGLPKPSNFDTVLNAANTIAADPEYSSFEKKELALLDSEENLTASDHFNNARYHRMEKLMDKLGLASNDDRLLVTRALNNSMNDIRNNTTNAQLEMRKEEFTKQAMAKNYSLMGIDVREAEKPQIEDQREADKKEVISK